MAKKRPRKHVEAPKPVEPAWDKATWMTLANVRLGVPAFVAAGAMHAVGPDEKITESEVRRLVKAFLSQNR